MSEQDKELEAARADLAAVDRAMFSAITSDIRAEAIHAGHDDPLIALADSADFEQDQRDEYDAWLERDHEEREQAWDAATWGADTEWVEPTHPDQPELS